ncbi:MAG: hypothetical protein GY749_50395 [Desulfobacteraceae bacterium]|nr:hypothetical protein [Desulfobacteraceae bacterium]
MLRRAGVIEGDTQLTDSTVLNSNIIYPNDVQLLYKAFRKMRVYAKDNNIRIWWNDDLLKSMWREFSLSKEKNLLKWLAEFCILFVSALEIFHAAVASVRTSDKRKKKAVKLLKLLELLKGQTALKLKGEVLFYDSSSGNITGIRCVMAKWGRCKDGCTHL